MFFFYYYYFRKNYIRRARFDAPFLLVNKNYKCMRCEKENISLYAEECPDCSDKNCDISINVGIAILKTIDKYCSLNHIDFADFDDLILYKIVRDALLDALPYGDANIFISCGHKMFRTYEDINNCKNLKTHKDEEMCIRLFHYYCNEYNVKKHYQHISKIIVEDLFGYNSYELDIKNDLSIIFGTNGLGKTTILKILDYLFIKPSIDRNEYNELNYNSRKYLESINIFDTKHKQRNDKRSITLGNYLDSLVKKMELYDLDFESYESNNQLTYNNIKLMSDNLIKDKIREIGNFLFKIPFKIARVDFSSGEFIQIEKIHNSQQETELKISYYSKDMEISDVQIKQVDGEFDENFFEKMETHYGNINKLFPMLNKKNRYLYIKVNRYGNVLYDFTNQIKKVIDEIKYCLNRDFLIDNNYTPKINIDFLFLFLRKHINQINKYINSWKNLMYSSKNLGIGDNENDEILQLSEQFNSRDNDEQYLERLLLYIIQYKSTNSRIKTIFERLIGIYNNYVLFKELFESLYDKNDPAKKRVDIINEKIVFRANKTLNDDFGEALCENDLSSGEKNIINILYNLIFKTSSGSIAFIDEPEISLHSLWQTQFPTLVKKVMQERPGIQVITTSHSPFITAGNDDYFVEPIFIK